MFLLAFGIGFYGFLIFVIGVSGGLSRIAIELLTGLYLAVVVSGAIWMWRRNRGFKPRLSLSPLEILFSLILLVFALVNLIGALGPEIFYDALWYHLTLPKIYWEYRRVFVIPGGLYYYSGMPQLVEMVYLAAMTLGSEILAKLVHFGFGLLSAGVVFHYGRKYIGRWPALFSAVVFYSSLGVAWQSTTADIDLGRTFFEAVAFFMFLNWWKERDLRKLIMAGVMSGFAIGTKYMALGSVGILGLMVFILANRRRFVSVLAYLLPAVVLAAPWFVHSFISTGNPLYPLLSGITLSGLSYAKQVTPGDFLGDFFRLSNGASDWVSPISPVYLVALPIVFVVTRRFPIVRVAASYFFLAYVVWFFTPRTGGSRFIIPYLPALSFVVGSILLLNEKKYRVVKQALIMVVVAVAMGNIFVRSYINSKIFPYLLRRESKRDYLVKNLDFRFDFYDTDGYFRTKIKSKDLVYVVGGQNLFYVDFPFVHESYWRGEKFNYLLVENSILPRRFTGWKKIYRNPLTGVELYQP